MNLRSLLGMRNGSIPNDFATCQSIVFSPRQKVIRMIREKIVCQVVARMH
jgi:hypothetical protein